MAFSRIARNGLRRTGGTFGSYAEKGTPCEGISNHSWSSSPFLKNVKAGSNLSYFSSIRKVNHASFWSRGIGGTPHYQFPNAERILEESENEYEEPRYPGLEATRPGEKPRVVVLGTGWAACRFMKGLDTKIYDVVCISPRNHMVYCETVSNGVLPQEPHQFKVAYDKLVIAAGAEPLTFGIPEEEKNRLLHCVVIGGGPTGVEFSGELSDFIMRDVQERYSHVKDHIKVTLIEANEILSSFDVGLRQYATNHLTKCGVRLTRGVVKEVHPTKLFLSDGTEVPYGLLVWSTGVGPSQFVKSLNLPNSPGGRIGIDQWLRVPSVEDVFALGDCAGFLEQTGRPVLPALAQVAERQGKYLVELFNNIGKQNGGKAFSAKDFSLGDPFVYRHLGSMASVGRYKALVDLRQSKDAKGLSLAGFISWLIWRSAYLTRVVSWRNRFYVAVNWATTLVFGRDNSRIG
ncbi:hypothetical protein GH714_018246 [Hevea brasiliensis]|uniref:NADH:ubiquinone reductase (non-electrogenic) n=1 Tax=Hevea brasiliensis TaxID=3981 RepID=A0A6A6LTQ8_HEVBR|nr:hypothetical protein GH714_018246 [Hevea brasiliensis]